MDIKKADKLENKSYVIYYERGDSSLAVLGVFDTYEEALEEKKTLNTDEKRHSSIELVDNSNKSVVAFNQLTFWSNAMSEDRSQFDDVERREKRVLKEWSKWNERCKNIGEWSGY